jgi:hypothetical protein
VTKILGLRSRIAAVTQNLSDSANSCVSGCDNASHEIKVVEMSERNEDAVADAAVIFVIAKRASDESSGPPHAAVGFASLSLSSSRAVRGPGSLQ